MILGVDPSIHHTGVAVVGYDQVLYHGTIPITEFGLALFSLSCYNIQIASVELCVVEQVGTYRQGKVTHAAASAIISSLSNILGQGRIITVAPQTWRKAILGNGRADKETARWYVQQRFGLDLPHDEAEAVCIALYGETMSMMRG